MLVHLLMVCSLHWWEQVHIDLMNLWHVLSVSLFSNEENGVLEADQPVLVFSHECQLNGKVLGCEHRFHCWTMAAPNVIFLEVQFDHKQARDIL